MRRRNVRLLVIACLIFLVALGLYTCEIWHRVPIQVGMTRNQVEQELGRATPGQVTLEGQVYAPDHCGWYDRVDDFGGRRVIVVWYGEDDRVATYVEKSHLPDWASVSDRPSWLNRFLGPIGW
jgi:hypothetical protein